MSPKILCVSTLFLFVLAGSCLKAGAQTTPAPLGLFETNADVGPVQHPGSAQFDAATHAYTVASDGYNMWFTNDAFHFVWKKVSGDFTLAADIALLGLGGDPHRKACLVIRQSLDSDSPYADAALHGSGEAHLQFRETPGALTFEIQAKERDPKRLRLEKRGNYLSMSIAGQDETLHPAGGSVRLSFSGPFYVGLAVCSHSTNVVEKAVFSNVELSTPARATNLFSTLEAINITSKIRRVLYTTTNHIEAPNWSRDWAFLVFNRAGSLYRLPLRHSQPWKIDTGDATNCNNDHGISPDGSQLVISSGHEHKGSVIYTLPIAGGTPKRITSKSPSYWHGWSPDGKTLAYCGERQGEFDIYTIPAEGGEETRLTTSKGLDDGPDYSPDGKFIYFNSERTGQMQIWRMNPDGTQQEQVTSDDYNNWFPHPSPDGKWILFLSYEKKVKGHPENQDVCLRLMPVNGGPIETLCTFFGGQGSFNVPCWSPDGREVAFVSYQFAP